MDYRPPLAVLIAVCATALACSDVTRPVARNQRVIEAATASSDVFLYNKGCPTLFTPWDQSIDPAQDHNGDGTVCVFETSSPDAATPMYAIIDNAIPPQTVGGCPKNFDGPLSYLIQYEGYYHPADKNQDYLVCDFRHSDGRVTTVDNNVR
jgi:hypothetical protein